jgi:hypothetical protein
MESTKSLSASFDYRGKYQLAESGKNVSYKSEEKIDFTFKNSDGDTLTVNASRTTSLTYTKNGTFNNAKIKVLSPEEGEELRKQLKQELIDYKEEIIKSFVEAHGGDWKKAGVENTDDAEVAELESKMPEYWNAENTSQRIVDFATSFLSAFEGEDKSEFFKKIRAAIQDGFDQALGELGQLPGAVGKLVDKTHRLVYEKLDAFEAQFMAEAA